MADSLKSRAGEFSSVMPVEHLLNVHAWACQFRDTELRTAIASALAKRIREVIASANDDRLYLLGVALAEPEERRYELAETVLRAARKVAAGFALEEARCPISR